LEIVPCIVLLGLSNIRTLVLDRQNPTANRMLGVALDQQTHNSAKIASFSRDGCHQIIATSPSRRESDIAGLKKEADRVSGFWSFRRVWQAATSSRVAQLHSCWSTNCGSCMPEDQVESHNQHGSAGGHIHIDITPTSARAVCCRVRPPLSARRTFQAILRSGP
jgi:hypothetical protein